MTGGPIRALSPERAAADLRRASKTAFDVLVIGGGIVGAGIALDAATRGLSVVVVEAEDWGFGSSSRSSKLIHGGLRYVRSRELALVREALHERAVLLDIAPHLVRPTPFLYPLRRRIERPYVGTGIALYDFLARLGRGSRPLPRGRHLDRSTARAAAPALRSDRVAGAVIYFDAQVDDARYVLAVIRTAASYGAAAVSRARVTSLISEHGKVSGARVVTEDAGRQIAIHAKAVVSATGAWTGELEAMDEAHSITLRPSKGVHLVVAKSATDGDMAMILPTSRSVLFLLPWGEHWIIGTTDTEWTHDPGFAAASAADIDYLLGEANAVLRRPIARSEVESVYVGIRPLLSSSAGDTTKLSREHGVAVAPSGLVLVAGGKYTTYRVIAEDALNAAVRQSKLVAGPSRTAKTLIAGGEGFQSTWAIRDRLAAENGLSLGVVERLLGRYGALVDEVLGVAQAASGEKALRFAPDYLRAEILYSVSHEGARHVDDVLVRRTRIAIETPDRGFSAAEEVAEIIAPLLGWDGPTRAREVDEFRRSLAGALAGEGEPNDVAAIAAMRAAIGARLSAD